MDTLCTLSQVKTLLGIAAEDASKNDLLNMYIKQASAKIEGFIGYSLKRATYTEELHSVNNRQLLQLNHFPLQGVTSVTANGQTVSDYKILPEYARWGRLYRGNGWTGNYYTRGFTHDIVSGVWEIEVSYTAGYYLPDDVGYVEGKEDSLPYDIVSCCLDMVVQRYRYEEMGAIGLKAHSEGHISDTYGDGTSDIGLSESAKQLLSRYVWVGLA